MNTLKVEQEVAAELLDTLAPILLTNTKKLCNAESNGNLPLTLKMVGEIKATLSIIEQCLNIIQRVI